jgi:hypothetical protein
MQPALAKILIDNQVIKEKTLVEAYHMARGLSCTENSNVLGTFAIIKAIRRDDKIFLQGFNEDNAIKEIDVENVISVDGMDEARLAKAFMFSTDGSKLFSGKRRGRKPKGYIPENTSEEDLALAYEFNRLLNYGWTEEQIAASKKCSLEEIDRVLNLFFDEIDEDDDEDEFSGIEEDDDEF